MSSDGHDDDDNGKERTTATAYPTKNQYEQWQERADEMGMSISEFIKSMTEAGYKKFDAGVRPDETNRELREQRNDLQQELGRARDRIESLENALHRTERAEIQRYVAENPGASYQEIVNHLMADLGVRVTEHLDDMEGIELESRDDRWYPREVNIE